MKAHRLPIVALALLVALALAAPLAAFPPDCVENCSCTIKCVALCNDWGAIMNCGTYGLCAGRCLAAPTSVSVEPADALRQSIFAAPALAIPVPDRANDTPGSLH